MKWIKIKSINDIPENGIFWHKDEHEVYNRPWDKEKLIIGFEEGLVTHIQKAIPPSK